MGHVAWIRKPENHLRTKWILCALYQKFQYLVAFSTNVIIYHQKGTFKYTKNGKRDYNTIEHYWGLSQNWRDNMTDIFGPIFKLKIFNEGSKLELHELKISCQRKKGLSFPHFENILYYERSNCKRTCYIVYSQTKLKLSMRET